ncbi:MAG: 1,6-anhydro-N-acetylmuramyl-L-alanine amidase AmpD, partial [Gammaproteobacteria bacterium]|nr:1,6-anhydro-N-acetylmuramyl-L-alanine amidase AmpD [Gammaproteobacteria bacterium]
MSLRVDTTSGLIAPARQVASPNCDERPSGSELELIVIHNISLPPHEYGGPWIDALFTNTLDP